MPKSKKQSNVQTKKFCIDCKVPFQDHVLDPASFMKFLQDKIKVEVKRESEDSPRIFVTAQLPFSKRYLKYLTKKYLKQQDLRDYLHVIASNASTYELKYFNIVSKMIRLDEGENKLCRRPVCAVVMIHGMHWHALLCAVPGCYFFFL
jgi:large subunit ribosomal protein L22e